MKTIVSMTGYQQFSFQSCVANNKVSWMRLDHPCALIHVLDRAVKIYFRLCLLLHAIRPLLQSFSHLSTQELCMPRGGCKDRALHVPQHCSRQRNRMSSARGCRQEAKPTRTAGEELRSNITWAAHKELLYVGGRLWETDKARGRGPWLVSAVGAVWGLGQILKSCAADGGCQSLLRPSPYFYDKGQVKCRNT